MDKRYFIGIDMGATFVKIARVGVSGDLIHKREFAVSDFRTRQRLIYKMVTEVSLLMGKEKRSCLGVGIGVPGPVDFKRGIIYDLTNIPGWKMVPIRDIISRKLAARVFVDNDANCACLGEMLWGAARGYRNIICLTLGSGVGGGIIIDGGLYHGPGYSAGEVGHVCIDPDGPACNCGGRGCVETFVGNKAIVREVIRRLKSGKKSLVYRLVNGDTSKITPQVLSQAAAKGDRLAIDVWQLVGFRLGVALASMINMLDPDIIVIGGGVSKSGDVLFDSIRKTVHERAMSIFVKGLKIKRARFVENAGIIGAAALVKISSNGGRL